MVNTETKCTKFKPLVRWFLSIWKSKTYNFFYRRREALPDRLAVDGFWPNSKHHRMAAAVGSIRRKIAIVPNRMRQSWCNVRARAVHQSPRPAIGIECDRILHKRLVRRLVLFLNCKNVIKKKLLIEMRGVVMFSGHLLFASRTRTGKIGSSWKTAVYGMSTSTAALFFRRISTRVLDQPPITE